MDFKTLSISRRSIRSFTPDIISDDIIMDLISSAVYAPSAGNCQPWHFYIIKDEKVKQRIADEACKQSFLSTAPFIIVVCTEAERCTERYGKRGHDLYCIQDTAAAVQNILLHAADIGLGGCWCGAFDESRISSIVNISHNRRPVAVIPIGYPNSKQSAPKRRPLDEVMTIIGESTAEIAAKTATAVDISETKSTTNYQAVPNNNNVKFEHCNLNEALFNDVNLGSSVFTNINLQSADISDANLSEVKIHDCNLSDVKINNSCIDRMTINGVEVSKLINDIALD